MLQHLRELAQTKSHIAAIHDESKSLNYGEFFQQACQLARVWLDDYQLTRDDCVAFCLPNCPMLVLCYLSCWIAGITAMPINPRLKAYELNQILDSYHPNCLVISDKHQTDELVDYCQASQTQLINYESDLENQLQQQQTAMPVSLNENPITIHLTSGTQGEYKAAEHSLVQITAYAHERAMDMGYQQDERFLICLSLNHAFAFSYQLLPALILAAPIVLVAEFNPDIVLEKLATSQATTISLLPTMSYLLTKHYQKQPLNLRSCLIAGDALPQAISQAFSKTFSITPTPGVGMTECYGYTLNLKPELYPNSAGQALTSHQIKICDQQGQALPANETGEIYVKSNAVMLSYYKAPALTAEVLQDGWLRTYDIGSLDEDGYLWFKGRIKQLIICGGSNIAPLEIESVCYQHPDVLEAAVVGVDDPVWLQIPVAYIVRVENSAVSEADLLAHLKSKLADYKLPRKITFIDALPKNATGKIDRHQLAQLAEANH